MKFLMVGLGSMGKYHMKKFSALGFELAGGVDTDPAMREEAKQTYGIPWTGEKISDFPGITDAVSLAVPDSMHRDCYIEADLLGKPMFLEKPLTRHLCDAEFLKNNLKSPCMVNFSKRNVGALFVLKNMLEEGSLGKIEKVEIEYCQNWLSHDSMGNWRENDSLLWRISPEFSAGGCFADLGAHMIETMIMLFGKIEFKKTLSMTTLPELIKKGRIQYSSSKEAKYHASLPSSQGQPIIPVDYLGLFDAAGIPCTIRCTFISDIYNEATIIKVFGSKATAIIDTTKDRKNLFVTYNDGTVQAIGGVKALPTYEMFKDLVSGQTQLLPKDFPSLERAVEVQRILEEVLY